jgi:nanoRNase/pAp phosphatase (c-di-AMP/oligoRNAs hydrolase)
MQIATTHKNTDFDGFASVIAATILFPDALAVLPKHLNPNVKAFLSIHKELFLTHTAADVDLKAVERLIVVDVNSWSRLDRMEPLKNRKGLEILLWDHHIEQGSIQASSSCIEPVGAATTLLVRELKKKRKLLTPMQATLLLAGIYEDTGNLTFPSTTSEDAHAAGWLLEHKADLIILSTFLKPAYSAKHKAILSQMLQNAERSKIKGHRISINKVSITGIPVVDDGRIVGMISRRDFRRVRKESQLKSPVKAFMSKEVLTIAPVNSPMQAAAIMVKHDVGRLPVVDDGRVIGILTRSDVMRFFYDLLPT